MAAKAGSMKATERRFRDVREKARDKGGVGGGEKTGMEQEGCMTGRRLTKVDLEDDAG